MIVEVCIPLPEAEADAAAAALLSHRGDAVPSVYWNSGGVDARVYGAHVIRTASRGEGLLAMALLLDVPNGPAVMALARTEVTGGTVDRPERRPTC